MKKFLSLALIAAILLTTMMVGVVSASALTYDAAIVVGSKTYVADIGDTFIYTIKIKSDKPLTAGQVELPVDFTYLSGSSQVAITQKMHDYVPYVADCAQVCRFNAGSATGLKGYVMNFATDNAYDFSGDQILFTLTFTVLKAGTISLNPTFREFLDADNHDVVTRDGVTVGTGFSSTVEVTLPPQSTAYEVKTPRITSIKSVSNGLQIDWNAVEGAPKYRIYRYNETTGWPVLAVLDSPGYVDTTVEPGKTYRYTVRAIGATGKTFLSEQVECGWSATYYAEPKVTAFESTAAGLQLTLSASPGAAGYRIYRKNGTTWASVGDVAGTTFTDPNVTVGTSYTYSVCALDMYNREISSRSATGYTAYHLGAPVLVSATCKNGYVAVVWNKMNGAVKYRVFRKNVDQNTGWFSIGETTGTTFNDKVVESGKTYTYTVRCITAAGAFASPFDSVGKTVKYLSQPSITKLTNISGGVTITISAVKGAAKYRYFKKSGTKWVKLADTTAVTYTDKGVKAGTAYTYTVVCINAAGNAATSTYNTTGWKVTYIAPPTLTSVTNTNGAVVFKWAKSAGAAKYRILRKTGRGKWVNMGYTAALSFTDKKVATGTTYTYTVCAVTANGKTVTSAYNTTGKAIKYIAAPTLKSVKKYAKGGVQFVWTKPKGAVKFRILRKVGNGKFVKLADTTSTSYIDKKVKAKTKYTYTVCCITANGKTVVSGYNTTGKAIVYK